MKILHTADWHLGKSLFGFSRLNEQSDALDELIALIKNEGVDLVLVCGDIFDTFVPKAEAERLFFDKLMGISKMCKVVVISGNHDDGERLCAPSGLALLSGIYLTGGVNGLKLSAGGEKVNLAALPYPYVSRILSSSSGVNNEERVKGLIGESIKCFDSGVNVFASHLFILGSELSEDRELGTAPLLPKNILPECDYSALGHIHRMQRVCKTGYYSGSLLKYSFDDKYDKYFLIYDSLTKETRPFKINAGKTLKCFDVSSSDEACAVLSGNSESYVKLNYFGCPLTPIEMKQIKSYPSFVHIHNLAARTEAAKAERIDAAPEALFNMFFESKTGKKPDNETVKLFLSLLNDEPDEGLDYSFADEFVEEENEAG